MYTMPYAVLYLTKYKYRRAKLVGWQRARDAAAHHTSHKEQGSVIRRYLIWRNKHPADERLCKVVIGRTFVDEHQGSVRGAPSRSTRPSLRAGACCVQAARKTYAVIGAVTGPGPSRAVISSMTVARMAGPSPRSSTAARTGVPLRYPVARSVVDGARP